MAKKATGRAVDGDWLRCPQCGNEEQGKICGWEICGVYDGVLFWVCLRCHHAFPRPFDGNPLRNAMSEQKAADFNAEAKVWGETP